MYIAIVCHRSMAWWSLMLPGDQHVHVFWHNLAPTNSLALVVKKTRLLSWLSFFSWSWVYIVCSGFAHAMLFENLYLSIGKKNLFDEPPWQQLAPTRHVFAWPKLPEFVRSCRAICMTEFLFSDRFRSNSQITNEIQNKRGYFAVSRFSCFHYSCRVIQFIRMPRRHFRVLKVFAYTDRWAVSSHTFNNPHW